jgi:hypothetical protein
MPPKQADTKTTASHQLLELNTELHSHMAHILDEMKQEEGIAVIPAAPVKNAAIAGGSALSILKAVSPKSAEIPAIEATSLAIAKVLEIIPEEDETLTMPADAAQDLVNKIINILANQIHDAAVALIGATGQVGGCSVSQIIPDEALSVSQYCTGVLPHISKATVFKMPTKKMEIKGKQVFIKYPQQIQHKLGVHHVEVSPSSQDGKVNVGIEYHDSVSYANSKQRWQGVLERLDKEGFVCQPKAPGTVIYCHGEIPKTELRRLATWFSLLLNADIAGMGQKTVGVVRDWAWDKAGELGDKYGEQTWDAGIGQVNWSGALHQWQEESELKKNTAVYTDLRNLAILRNKHHELEEKYGISSGKASRAGAEQIVKNAQEAIDIAKKNNWSTHGLESHVGALANQVKTGAVGNIAGISDGIGHIMHIVLTNQLDKIGTYAGCQMSSDIDNINAGNLAYCEGVLKGTNVQISKGGNYYQHKVAPETYTTFTLDEDPDGGHHVTFWIPSPAEWGEPVSKFLQEHENFKCSGNQCKAYIKNLDDIRELALFFSNLRGASEKIGSDCGAKALEMAFNAAKEYNKKGVFAFTLEPIMETDKAWVKLCHQNYGIMPPGLTEEEKKIMSTIGPQKTYGGCSFAETEDLPNQGQLIYCEGVRKNPQANISAYMNGKGNLHHFYHHTTDEISKVTIMPTGENTYQVTLDNIDFRGAALQKEMIKAMQTLFPVKCSGDSCTGEVKGNSLRKLAAFVSSVHQIYKLPETCVHAAVNYAWDQVASLPDNLDAHASVVHPWVSDQWKNTVCSKIKPSEMVPPTEAKAAPPGVAMWTGMGATPKPPFIFKGCTSFTKEVPTKVKASYCSGVVGVAKEDDIQSNLTAPGNLPGTTASLGTKENKHWLGGPNVIFDSKWSELYITLPDELLNVKPLVQTLIGAYKMTQDEENPKTFKRWYGQTVGKDIARFLSYCTNIQTLPEWCHKEAVKWALTKAKQGGPIYPYKVEDWFNEVCSVAEEAPGAGKPPFKPMPYYTQLHDAILEYLKEHSPDHTTSEIIKAMQSKFTVDASDVEDMLTALQKDGLIEATAGGWKAVTLPGEEKKIAYADIPSTGKSNIEANICSKKQAGQTIDQVFDWFAKGWGGVEFGATTKGILTEIYEKCLPSEFAKKKTIDQLTGNETAMIADYICTLKNKGLTFPQTQTKVFEDFSGFQESPEANVWIKKTYDACGFQALEANIEASKQVFDQLQTELFKDAALQQKCKEAAAYKKLPKKCKDMLHAYMNWQLLQAFKDEKTAGDILPVVQKNIIDTFPYLTPLMVKLQLDIEKKNKVRKGEIPAELGEKVALTYETLPTEEKDDVDVTITSFLEEGYDLNNTLNKVAEAYGLEKTTALMQAISKIDGLLKKPGKKYEDLTGEEKAVIDEYIVQESDYPTDTVVDFVFGTYGIPSSDALKQKIIEVQGGYVPEKEEELQSWDELSNEVKQAFAIKVTQAKVTGWDELKEAAIEYGIVPDEDVLPSVLDLNEMAEAAGKVPQHYSDMPPEKQSDISTFIHGEAEEGQDFEGIKEGLELKYPELEWDAEVETLVKEAIEEHGVAVVEPFVLDEFILKEMEKSPETLFTPAILHNMLVVEGYDIPEDEISETLKQLTEDGKVLWLIGEEKYKHNPSAADFETVKGVVVPSSFVEATKKTITDMSDQGLSLPNIVQNAYSPYWQSKLKPNQFKEWVKEVIQKSYEEEEKMVEEVPTPPTPLDEPWHYAVAKVKEAVEGTGIPECYIHKVKQYATTGLDELNIIVSLFLSSHFIHEHSKEFGVTEDTLKKLWTECVDEYKAGAPVIAKPLTPWDMVTPEEKTNIARYVKKELDKGTSEEIILKALVDVANIDIDTLPPLIEVVEQYAVLPMKFTSKEELKSIILQDFESNPGEDFDMLHIITSMEAKGYEPPKTEYIDTVLDEMEKSGQIEHHVKGMIAYWHLVEKPVELVNIKEYPMSKLPQVNSYIIQQAKAGNQFKYIANNLSTLYNIELNEALEQHVKDVMAAAGIPPKEKKPPVQVSLTDLATVIDAINKGIPQFGCYPDHPGVVISNPQAIYCQGIQTPPGAKKAGYVQVVKDPETGQPVTIVSQYGDGYNAIATSPSENGLSVSFKEVDEKGPQWKQRQQVVAELLTEMGYGCSFLNDHFVCARDDIDMGEEGDQAIVRTTALFFSKLHGIDELDYACVNRAVRFALAQAHEQETALKFPWEQEPYPYTIADWNKEVCEKAVIKPVKEKAAEKAKELGTVKLLELAHDHGIDPTGSDAALAQKIIEAGIIDP